jgi:hypothetical protein
MSFLGKIKTFFTKKTALSNDNLVDISNEEKTEILPNYQEKEFENQPLQSPSLDEPYWLANEDALRDEGVIFGLSEAKAEDKIAVIRNYFSHQTANLEKEITNQTEKIGELNLFLEQKETRINELNDKATLLENRLPMPHTLLRTVVGLVLSLAICVGNYFLIDEAIQTKFPVSHSLISAGVFLAGMFNLFHKISFLHEKDTSISWRQLLEEVGMPLAASVFVFAQIIDNQPIIRSLALLFFVFFLFLFAGKLLLSNLNLIKSDFENWMNNLRLKADKTNKAKEWEAEILQLKTEMDDLRINKWQIINELKSPETELARLHGKRDMLIKLFESEFNLARSYREKLTAKQIKEILD